MSQQRRAVPVTAETPSASPYCYRAGVPGVEVAFTARVPGKDDDSVLDLALDRGPAVVDRVVADFAPGAAWADMRQVHGAHVAVAEAGRTPEADALVTDRDLVLVVRVADCVPVLLADPDAGIAAAVHAGRPGVEAGVVTAALERMRAMGARRLLAWVGPHVCGACYEVPEQMRTQVAALVPDSWATTSWGTAALDLGAAVRAQLLAGGVVGAELTEVGRCTREHADLHSYRRDGASAGRLAGLVRLTGAHR